MLLLSRIAGIFFIFGCGTLLHHLFKWSGRSRLVAPVAPVNESLWEHFKMFLWPGLLIAPLEYALVGREHPGFAAGTAAGLLLMPLATALGFYAYTAVLGRHVLALDIALFLVAVVAGQLTGHLVMTEMRPHTWMQFAGVAALTLMVVLHAVTTFRPPRFGLFRDPVRDCYGIPDEPGLDTGP